MLPDFLWRSIKPPKKKLEKKLDPTSFFTGIATK
jgi:hypothetical protein